MTIELKPENYYVGFWYSHPGTTEDTQVDLMGCMWKEPDGSWKGTYRFRYYDEDSVNAWDKKDRKSWFDLSAPPGTSDEDAEKLKEALNMVFQQFADKNDSKFEFLEIDGDGEKALEVLQGASFTHIRTFEQHEMN